MHDCPECGQACDCDGEDTWFEYVGNCAHECEDELDDSWAELIDYDYKLDEPLSEESGK